MGLLNNLEDSGVADSQVTKPCTHVTCMQCASQCHHCDILTNSPQTPEAYMSLFFLYDDVSPHQVLPIKDDTSCSRLLSSMFLFPPCASS